ncbi:MAG: precorrin-6y C5,15-methyltransferase (decarboxylating) subunit CbiE [Clostridium sp.]
MKSNYENEGKVFIIGLGPGHRDYILPKAIETLKSVDLILGFKRALESIDFIEGNKEVIGTLKDTVSMINENKELNIGVLASGDPSYYGITNYIKNNVSMTIEVIPGLSSFQYLTTKLVLPWQGAYLGSMHGREDNFINKVKEYEMSLWLTDKKYKANYLCEMLVNANIRATMYVGENLSYEDEKITIGTLEELRLRDFSDLSVVVIKKS